MSSSLCVLSKKSDTKCSLHSLHCPPGLHIDYHILSDAQMSHFFIGFPFDSVAWTFSFSFQKIAPVCEHFFFLFPSDLNLFLAFPSVFCFSGRFRSYQCQKPKQIYSPAQLNTAFYNCKYS